jgi:hypothetical protein
MQEILLGEGAMGYKPLQLLRFLTKNGELRSKLKGELLVRLN